MATDEDKRTTDDGRIRELSPGKLLVWARERAGLTQEQAAKDLYMTLTKVRALEADDYRHMASDTFTRGYLRAYANLVKLDVVQLLAAYDRYLQKQGGLAEEIPPRQIESANKPLWQFIVLVMLVFLILWLVSVWFFDNRQQPDYNRPMSVIPPVVTALPMQASEGPNIGVELISSSSAVIESAIGAQQPVPISSDKEATPDSTVSLAEQNEEPVVQKDSRQLDSLTLSFREECWLEVSDAKGDVLVANLQSSGSRLELSGRAPFDVKLGNAPSAKIELNGDNVAIVPAIGTNVLSIKVGKSPRE